MAYDTLLFDFVYEMIREKILIGSNEFTESDVRVFFKNIQLQDAGAAGWTDEMGRAICKPSFRQSGNKE